MDKTKVLPRCGLSFWTTVLPLTAMLVLSGCGGESTGTAGTNGINGTNGTNGVDGADGATGAQGPQGLPGLGIKVADRHGLQYSALGVRGENNSANLCTTITGASVNATGNVVIDFKVASMGADLKCGTTDDVAYKGLAASVATFRVAQLQPGADPAKDNSFWVNYSNTAVPKKACCGTMPAATVMNQPGGEGGANGTWTDNGNGTYKYVTKLAVTAGVTIANAPSAAYNGTYTYNANLPHRIAIQLADHDGTGPATSGANNPIYDFTPATGVAAVAKEVVVTSNCNECHTTLNFHGGGRLETKMCVMCHNPTAGDPESGNTIDFKVMLHKIHMGKALPSVAFDFVGDAASKYNKNPVDANGKPLVITGTQYRIWGHNAQSPTTLATEIDFSEIGFPAGAAACTKCHKNGAQSDNWKTKPTKEACGSCHDGINFADGMGTRIRSAFDSTNTLGAMPGTKVVHNPKPGTTDHLGGAQADNSACSTCHTSSTTPVPVDSYPVGIPAAHDVVAKTKTDYTIDVTMTPPGNGTHYVAGESPVVTVVLTNADGSAVDHTTVSTGTVNLYAYGPRSLKKPVLTTLAAKTGATAPSTAGNSLLTTTTDPKVARSAASITYALSDVAGLASGTYFIQVQATKPVNLTSPKTMSVKLLEFQVGTATAEKKVAACKTCHESTLWHDSPTAAQGNHPAPFDPDYCAACHDYNVHAGYNSKLGGLSDGTVTQWKSGGRCVDTKGTASTGDDTLDPSRVTKHDCLEGAPGVAVTMKFVTGVCYVSGTANLTIANNNAPSYPCTAAGGVWENYGANNKGFGAAPIARRVHGVHFGKRADKTPGVSKPFEIYDGHNVAITFPQDVKNCEVCHNSVTNAAGTAATSGTWKTKSGRVPCLACHDTDATIAHGTLMTVDPTPVEDVLGTYPGSFSGDEQESCSVCHN